MTLTGAMVIAGGAGIGSKSANASSVLAPAYANDFEDATDYNENWNSYYGAGSTSGGWEVKNGKLHTVGNPGPKTVYSNGTFTDFICNAEVKVTGLYGNNDESNAQAGLLFRVNPTSGKDGYNNYDGYYFAINAKAKQIMLGYGGTDSDQWYELALENNDKIDFNKTYQLYVACLGSTINARVTYLPETGSQESSEVIADFFVDTATTPGVWTTNWSTGATAEDNDAKHKYSSGSVGFRTFQGVAEFDNLSVWTRYKVKGYELNGGTLKDGDELYTGYFDNSYSEELPELTKDGYQFNGWFADEACTQKIDKLSSVAADRILYAGFSKINHVAYELNGGTNNVSNKEEFTGNLVLKDPTKEGYRFDGWYLDAAFNSKVTVLNDNNSEGTVYAKWTRVYKVTYVLNGGNNADSNLLVYESAFTLADPTRKGYAFKGWYLDEAFTNAVTELNAQTENKTIYAKWAKIVNIEYMLDGGTNDVANVKEFTDSFTLKPATKTGYDFGGWFTDSAYTKEVKVADESIDGLILYAKFTAKPVATPPTSVVTVKKPGKATIKALVSPKKKTIKVTIKKKISGASGYTIMLATDKKFKKNKKTVNLSAKKTSVTIKGLKSKKVYYVKVQTYTKKGSKKAVAAWSAVKKIKVK
ncbi:MAG: InlB B-repeat-containing protein [Lachnospiraceae bacterium]|nr:InlB B-repeat-containing protein [Lachnospiraceae bacterium]